MLPLFDRTLTLAVLEPMGRISGNTTVAGVSYNQDANGFGDPMVEVGIQPHRPQGHQDHPRPAALRAQVLARPHRGPGVPDRQL